VYNYLALVQQHQEGCPTFPFGTLTFGVRINPKHRAVWAMVTAFEVSRHRHRHRHRHAGTGTGTGGTGSIYIESVSETIKVLY
jgi:hypothetical protein